MHFRTLLSFLLLLPASSFSPTSPSSSKPSTVLHSSKDALVSDAKKLNPLLGYFDPLQLTDAAFWGQPQDSTIGFLRHAEIKHSRVAMAAFVGYCVQSNFVWPWPETLSGDPFPSTSLSPPEQWDALPLGAKVQIILFVGFLEFYSELTPGEGSDAGLTHYMKGGVPGKFPTFDAIPHWMPFNTLYDPFKYAKNMSEETKQRRLLVEVNNGRLAMLGIFGFLCAQTIPGSVPALEGVVKAYGGEVMAPLAPDGILEREL
eukprot:CAMPEP_0182501654 /NCGR_PEP_ID=MMETSP1321-20130603/11842_1 /TAXON_ID=91990 /ORGANISM="Bolidomonas sp., Strain RCC1657" /LENGTH=258 /DNA_ID=CAMNT_0024706371 /DNA_START=74 /DNA_END=847 /DNA_ORIENTATION=+